jgi:hypothetical protein
MRKTHGLEEPEGARASRALAYVPIAQGVYYVATGLWPIVNIRTFEAVSGKKREHWLVKTIGLLIAGIGGALVVAGKRRRSR